MRLTIFLSVVIIGLLAACSKNKFETKPQIKIKSVNATVIPFNGNLSISLSFTDKEGDISEGRLVYQPVRLNRRGLESGIPPYDTVSNPLPKFPDQTQGEIQVYLAYQNIHKSNLQNDTINMRFVAYDRAGHKSDTVTSERIVILKN